MIASYERPRLMLPPMKWGVGSGPQAPNLQSLSPSALIRSAALRDRGDRAFPGSNKFQIRISIWSVEASVPPRALRSLISRFSRFVSPTCVMTRAFPNLRHRLQQCRPNQALTFGGEAVAIGQFAIGERWERRFG